MNLENISLWYDYKTKVWLDHTSPQSASVHNIMKVLRAVRGTINYLSTPVTSGKWLYDQNRKVPFDELIAYNYIEANKFLDEMSDIENLLLPSDLTPTLNFKWAQDHFQALWLTVIAEKAKNVYMNDGWEFSNGCTEELVHTFQLRLGIPRHKDILFFNTKEKESDSILRMKNIKIYDRNRNEISIDQAIESLNNSIPYIAAKNHPVDKLAKAKECLEKTRDYLNV